MITEQQKLLELITEKRQALISHVVTKGLNPDAPMKDSGIDWLGQIPTHWEVKQIKYVAWVRARLGWKGLKAEEYVDEGYAFLATPNIKNKNIDLENVNFITQERYDESPEIKLANGDVLLAKDGSTLGTVNYVRDLPFPTTVNSSIAVITPKHDLNTVFLYYLFQSTYLKTVIEVKKGGMGVPHLFQDDINRFPIPLPSIDEQEKIIAFIEVNTRSLDILQSQAEHAIELLKERRSALISAAVTGKFFVGKVAEKKQEANVFFKRSVFAAEIINRMHREPTFGHVKFQKILFLAENICGIDLATHYHSDVAGPYDNRAIRSIDSQLEKQKWFRCQKDANGYCHYCALDNSEKYKTYFDRYFSEKSEQLAALCNRFMRFNTEQCEIVATLFSAWKDLLTSGSPADDQIVDEVLNNWHPSKRRIERKRWLAALGWMKVQHITPGEKYEFTGK